MTRAEVKESGIRTFPSVSIQAGLRHHSISVDFERERHKRMNCNNIVNCPLLSTVPCFRDIKHDAPEKGKQKGKIWCKNGAKD